MVKATFFAVLLSLAGDALANDGRYRHEMVYKTEHAVASIARMRWTLSWSKEPARNS